MINLRTSMVSTTPTPMAGLVSCPTVALRPASDSSFTLMDNRPLVFSERNQQIFELNGSAAFIWCKLLEREKTEAITKELSNCGMDGAAASRLVQQALNQWLELGLVDLEWEPSSDWTLHTRFAQRTIAVQCSNERLLRLLEPLFGHSARGHGPSDILIEAVENADQAFFRLNGGRTFRCEIDQLAPAIKACLTERLILSDRADVALHAASLIRQGNGLLVCGNPGVGKSTLSVHLCHAGFQYGGDDVVFIAPDGEAEGLPFPLTVKSGAWDIISRLRSDLRDQPVHRRSDEARVRYLPAVNVHHGRFAAKWIVFLQRSEGLSTKLIRIGQIDAIGRILEGSFAADGKLSRRRFIALKRMLTEAECFELIYSDAADAARVLTGLCHGDS